jgi:BESS motif
MIVIDYHNDEMESSDNESSQVEKYSPKKSIKTDASDSEHHIIIEPFELEYEEEEEIYHEPASSTAKKDPIDPISSTKASTSFSSPNPMGSNELFLKSLVAMMDRLPEDKNMRARIKIQEVLYKIAYD